MVYFRTSVESVPSAEPFVHSDCPVFHYLDFLLPLIEPSVSRLRLSVAHILLQQGLSSIPRPLFPYHRYLMSRRVEDVPSVLGDSHPVTWELKISVDDEPEIRQICQLPASVRLRFDTDNVGAVVDAYSNEVCVYMEMFRIGLKLPFPRIVRELLSYIQIAPHQLAPNGWRVFFACMVVWSKILGVEHPLTVVEFLKIYRLTKCSKTEFLFTFQLRKKMKPLTFRRTYSSNKWWKDEFFFVQGDWEFSPSEVIRDPSVPRETIAPSNRGKNRASYLFTISFCSKANPDICFQVNKNRV